MLFEERMTLNDTQYTPYLLPTNDKQLLPLLANKYTKLRLKGLIQSPQSFSASFEGEKSLSEKEQIERLQVTNKHIVVIVAHSQNESIPLYNCEWVAQATLYGPNTWEDHILPFKQALPLQMQMQDDQFINTTQVHSNQFNNTAFWQMTALYVDANHRRRGLGNQLCKFAFEVMQAKLPSNKLNYEMRIFIKPTNSIVIEMYEHLQFIKVSQTVSLCEAFFVAGDQSTLPDGYQENEAYTNRVGIIMTRRSIT